jgi:hypothetical protein
MALPSTFFRARGRRGYATWASFGDNKKLYQIDHFI